MVDRSAGLHPGIPVNATTLTKTPVFWLHKDYPILCLQALELCPLEVCHQLAPAVTMLLLPWSSGGGLAGALGLPGPGSLFFAGGSRTWVLNPAPRLLHWGKIVWSCCGGGWQRWLLLAGSAKLIHT